MNQNSPIESSAPDETDAEQTRIEKDVVMSARDLSVSFDMERGTSKVLNDVDLDIYRNEVLGIVGESGSGKSMFADSLLNAVVKPGVATGQVTFYPKDGEPVEVLSMDDEELRQYRWETVSMVFQGAMSSFNPTQKIEEHFRETLRAHDRDVEEGMEHARELLADLYLEPDRVLDSFSHELSGGMKQRALIALSLVLDPEVLVMDEPTAALDLLMQKSILTLLEDLKEKYDLTIVFITHDLPLVASLADRMAVLYGFEFMEIGPTQTIVNSPKHPYTRSLLKAVPDMSAPLSEMQPIKGSSPDPVDTPTGCSYHPRCPLADEKCQQEDPPLLEVDKDHRSACFYWNQAEEAIPLARSEAEESEEYDS
jgi:oligopeptide/dipeptide ABC transporter ATP-binding protein